MDIIKQQVTAQELDAWLRSTEVKEEEKERVDFSEPMPSSQHVSSSDINSGFQRQAPSQAPNSSENSSGGITPSKPFSRDFFQNLQEFDLCQPAPTYSPGKRTFFDLQIGRLLDQRKTVDEKYHSFFESNSTTSSTEYQGLSKKRRISCPEHGRPSGHGDTNARRSDLSANHLFPPDEDHRRDSCPGSYCNSTKTDTHRQQTNRHFRGDSPGFAPNRHQSEHHHDPAFSFNDTHDESLSDDSYCRPISDDNSRIATKIKTPPTEKLHPMPISFRSKKSERSRREPSKLALVNAMEKSQKSQDCINEWDRMMGLKLSHCKTMQESTRTRKFLFNAWRQDLMMACIMEACHTEMMKNVGDDWKAIAQQHEYWEYIVDSEYRQKHC